MKKMILLAMAIVMAGCGARQAIQQKVQDALVTARPLSDGVMQPVGSETEWQRAQIWLANHSKWKIQIATDTLLQTYNPREYSISYGFSVMKAPVGDGQHHITMSAVCDAGTICNPPLDMVKRAFYHYLETGEDLLEGLGYLSAIN